MKYEIKCRSKKKVIKFICYNNYGRCYKLVHDLGSPFYMAMPLYYT